MSGSPPPGGARVTLDNWQDPPYNRWSFQHLREVIPTQRIRARVGGGRPLPTREDAAVLDVPVHRLGGSGTLAEVLADTWTDAVVLAHDGAVVLERYHNHMARDTTHLMMSVSKSVVGCVTGILADHGLLRPEDEVRRHVPEIEGSGYDGATVRDLLDMRTGVRFSEAYLDPDAEVRVIERHMGWRPAGSSDASVGTAEHDADPGSDEGDGAGLYRYLTTLGREGPHGGPFTYRSSDTDMLGWVCERAAGRRMADLVSTLLWQPMGAEHDAEITCDRFGSAVHDGGMCAAAVDLAKLGQLLLDDGRSGEQQVVPHGWLRHAWSVDPDVRAAFRPSDAEAVLPGGWYRSQFWFVPGPSGDVLLCLGIHGQMVLVDRETRTVAVKLSSWPTPQHSEHLIDTIRGFTAAGRHLAGLPTAYDEIAEHVGPADLSGH